MVKVKKEFKWSNLYCGISHLLGIPNRYRITLAVINNKLSVVEFFDRERVYQVFTPFKTFRGTKVKCVEKGLKWATQITG